LNFKVNELKDKRNKLLTDMQQLSLAGFNTESRSSFDKMSKEVDALESDIAREERMAKYETEQREANYFERSAARGPIHGSSGNERRDRLNKAMRSFMVNGRVEAEYRDLLTTSDATGGALIPQEFEGVLNQALKFYGPISQEVRQRVTDNNGAPLKVSLSNDTSNGLTLLATEGTSSPTETDPTFSSKIVGVDTLSGGLVKVSVQELQDSSFNLDTLLEEMFSLRYGRGLEKAITLGTDSAGTTLPNQTSGGLLGAAPIGFTTATLAGGIGWTDLVSVYSAVDPPYLPNAKWSFSSSTRSYLISLKDAFGRPFFVPDPSDSAPFDKLMGFPIVINQAMPNATSAGAAVANATPVLFGDYRQAYLLRTESRPSIVKLDERYMDTLEKGYLLYTRTGGTSLIQSASPAVVKLKLAAS